MQSRRKFLISAGRMAVAARVTGQSLLWAQHAEPLPLSIRGIGFRPMAVDFTGLSYEMPQLYNPRFFSAANTQLVDAFRNLSANGVLRMGGNLSDVARWKSPAGDFATEKQTAAIEHGKTYWEWKLTDESVRANRDGAITPEAIQNLKGFLDATNWRLIYGLNFGSGSPERAADEASWVARSIGSRLIAFQVGNESDFFGGNPFFRQRSFNFEDYLAGYRQFVDAVRAKVPNAPFAGPDTAANMGWVDQFAKGAEAPILLSSHYYAMGPAKDPAMDAARLLAPSPKLDRQIELAQQAVADASGVPFRMTEGNSCFGGGKPGVSDAFASALWAADYMLHVACAGYRGVNLHGGGDGFYTPIESLADTSSVPRPLYYGMQFANRFAGGEVAPCSFGSETGVTGYVGRSTKGLTQIAMINKTATEVRVRPAGDLRDRRVVEVMALTAPDLASTQGISFAAIKGTSGEMFVLPPYSGRLILWA